MTEGMGTVHWYRPIHQDKRPWNEASSPEGSLGVFLCQRQGC